MRQCLWPQGWDTHATQPQLWIVRTRSTRLFPRILLRASASQLPQLSLCRSVAPLPLPSYGFCGHLTTATGLLPPIYSGSTTAAALLLMAPEHLFSFRPVHFTQAETTSGEHECQNPSS